ncbi:MAG TPA: tyrosine-protein phosphatase [Gemmataceae bacterium]|nr:tyrosine-protein phosphatase [Gemmataceae bacterium]
MPRYLTWFFGTLIAGFLVAGPVVFFNYQQAQFRHFRVVRDGVLYRSGQMSLAGLQRVIHDYGIRTVVTLRDASSIGEPPPDWEEEEYCRSEDINYVRIPPRTWWSADGSVPAEKGIRQFLEVMDHPENYPVLVHCFAGIHRTGAICAVYRMEYQDWTNTQAIAEMKACGYNTLEDEWDVLGYIEKYQPRKKR